MLQDGEVSRLRPAESKVRVLHSTAGSLVARISTRLFYVRALVVVCTPSLAWLRYHRLPPVLCSCMGHVCCSPFFWLLVCFERACA